MYKRKGKKERGGEMSSGEDEGLGTLDVRDLTPQVGRIIYSDVIKVNINKA